MPCIRASAPYLQQDPSSECRALRQMDRTWPRLPVAVRILARSRWPILDVHDVKQRDATGIEVARHAGRVSNLNELADGMRQHPARARAEAGAVARTRTGDKID